MDVMPSQKSEIITFKADRALLQAMQGLPNRSEFIRSAVLAALDSACPLCRGTGILSAPQRQHWSTLRAQPYGAGVRRLPRVAPRLRSRTRRQETDNHVAPD